VAFWAITINIKSKDSKDFDLMSPISAQKQKKSIYSLKNIRIFEFSSTAVPTQIWNINYMYYFSSSYQGLWYTSQTAWLL